MNTVTFASAYRMLQPTEKAFVDAYVADAESAANRANERISLILHRPVPSDVIDASRGMLEKPMVVAAISERVNDLAAQSELTVHRVIKELMGVAFSSIGHYIEIDADGSPMFDLTKCTPEQLAAIQSVEVEEMPRTGARKFKMKLHDKMDGIKMLATYMGLLERDNPHYRAETARVVQQTTLPADISDLGAAEAYGQMLNDE